jgi:copper homeostasis protein
MPNRVIVEICVDSIESAIAADRGGADRVELCGSLIEGGITPSAGLTATVLGRVSLGVFAMIRPRAGDFLYSPDEFKAMERDILMAKQLGADGVVFGILNEDGGVDSTRVKRLVEVARPLKITFHRAFDVSRDLSNSLEDLIGAGVDRVLTSGGEQTAELGKARIAELKRQGGARIALMAGSGINENNARQLIAETGVREIHASLRTPVQSPMRYRNKKISFTTEEGGESQHLGVREESVRKLVEAANAATQN